MKTDYLIISPGRNEAEFMRATLDSVIAQTIRPRKWVIVDDGSTDESPEILAEYAARHDWIEIVTREDRGRRAVGSGVMDAFYAGFETVGIDDYDFICKLDLDLILPPRYFETLLGKMHAEPRLGSVSGKAYIRSNGELVSERHGDETSIGASKFYRVRCFKDIGGFIREVMWDGIDCHRCRMRGWIACSIDEPGLRFEHLRPMGSSQQSILTGRIRHGQGQYFMGSGLMWMLATAIYRIPEKPYVTGGLFIVWGWLKSRLQNRPRYDAPGFRKFLRQYQRRALLVGKRRAIAEIDARNAQQESARSSDFERNLWCLLGIPIDVIGYRQALMQIASAAASGQRCFFSTPNLNFIVGALSDRAFLESVIRSDRVFLDGMPPVWIARLLGIPGIEKVSGSNLFESLWQEEPLGTRKLRVFLFGGEEGVAAEACARINELARGIECAGYYYPGFESIEAMSDEKIIERINAAGADFVVVALGAKKGQAWITRNLGRLQAPVVSHLGAVVNFAADRVLRAPRWMQRSGLEWSWRIYQEPALWKRYLLDGVALARLMLFRVIPYALWRAVHRKALKSETAVRYSQREDANSTTILLQGDCLHGTIAPLRTLFEMECSKGRAVILDLGGAGLVDGAFLGLCLLLRKVALENGFTLSLVNLSPTQRRIFRWNCADYLL